jgi:poly(hydroxyalkanoate) depolymerase family esterase
MTDHSHRVQARLAEVLETSRRRGAGGAWQPSAADESVFPAILPDRLREAIDSVVRGLGRGVAPVLKGLGGQGAGLRRGTPRPQGGGEFVARSFSDAAGARDYKLYIPAGAGRQRPLVVMLHGCKQSPDDFAAGTAMNALAEADGVFVAYPGQSSRANGHKCWNWFEPRDQGREGGEAGIIAGITRAVIAEHGIDPRRVYIAGLSAGAAAAANVAQAYPDLYAAVGIHSGLAAGCARDLSSAMMAMNMGAPGSTPPSGFGASPEGLRLPTIVFHGDGDTTVHPRNGEQVLAQAGADGLRALDAQGEPVGPGGLAYSRTRFADAAGRVRIESWRVHGLAHAWSGGDPAGSYTDPRGPDASRAMLDFFLTQSLAPGRA